MQIESLPALIPTTTDRLRGVQRLICTASVIRHTAPLPAATSVTNGHQFGDSTSDSGRRLTADLADGAFAIPYADLTGEVHPARPCATDHLPPNRARSIGRTVTCYKLDYSVTTFVGMQKTSGLAENAKLHRVAVV